MLNNELPNSYQKYLGAGAFMLALATTSLELLLPRIWSVTLWYHFAFAAISFAMFGITAGALIVFIFPKLFVDEKLKATLPMVFLLFASSIVFSFLTQLSLPYFPDPSIVGLYSLVLICLVISIPFVLSGIATTLILTKFPLWVGQMYALDLCGAAFACLSTLAVLNYTDAPTAVICSALWASVGAFILAESSSLKKLARISMLLSLSLAIFVAANTFLCTKQSSLLRPIWVKAQYDPRPLYEKWNSFSRVSVTGDPDLPEEPTIAGLSSTYPKGKKARELRIEMDAYLATIIPHFSGDFDEVDYLKYDLTNLAHFLRSRAKVLIIGTGGGKDILSALVFQQKSVTGLEINEAAINTVTKRFGDFSGHLDKDPRVSLVNDEARSFIARQTAGFDIIQMAAIDTGMATGAGAFALTENSLYTTEAWKTFLEKLSPSGILSCSRWYNPNLPAEIYRLAALSREALKSVGVTNPRQCMVVLAQKPDSSMQSLSATALISKQPFSASDLSKIKKLAEDLNFDVVLIPGETKDKTLENILSGINLKFLERELPVRIDAPTDDSPYFFYQLKPYQVLTRHSSIGGEVDVHSRAEVILFELAAAAILLGSLAMTVPAFIAVRNVHRRNILSGLVYFASIGLGFMFIEVSQLQRLIILLGHPSYSLSVVLFTLLISSGIGSYLTGMLVKTAPLSAGLRRSNIVCLTILIALLAIYGLFTPSLLAKIVVMSTPIRICFSVAILFPIGLFMGTAMPLGLRLASPSLTPWLWAVNGAASVCASVLTVAIAVMAGISAAFWTGVICYCLALLALFIIDKSVSQ